MLCCAEICIFQGSSQLEVHGRLTGVATTQTMLVEGRAISQRPLVLVATAVVKPCTGKGAAEVPVRILNLSPDGVTIYKGTRLVHHWKRIMLYSFLSPHCCKDVSADKRQLLWQTVESTASDLTDGQRRQLFEV